MKKLLLTSSLKHYMKPSLSEVFQYVSLVIFAIFLVVYITRNYGHHTVVYDCRMAEISPDFPPEVRNECRKLRSIKQ